MTVTMQIVPLEHKISGGWCTRSCRIIRTDDGVVNESELWFQFSDSVPSLPFDDCDAYLIALMMDAMKEGRQVEVAGSVSAELLSNLVEFQAAWNKWLPPLYREVQVAPERIRNDRERVDGAICAFSGGVDATFSVWRHTQSRYGHRSQSLNACSIVHGFDIHLDQEVVFENARTRSERTLGDVGVALEPIRTNYRQVSTASWDHAFAPALVAALSNFRTIAGTCIIGSSEPYDSLVIPWGSSPITDHLLSSDGFVVMHDGASHSRTEKVAAITEWRAGTDNLRVCWEGEVDDGNCGSCEKCVRTKLNFLAIGSPIPASFPESNLLDDLDGIVLKNDAVRAEWQQIYDMAKKNGIGGDWMERIPDVLKRKTLLDRLLPRGSARRETVKNMARRPLSMVRPHLR